MGIRLLAVLSRPLAASLDNTTGFPFWFSSMSRLQTGIEFTTFSRRGDATKNAAERRPLRLLR
jgi:hypothetical protein